MDQEKDLKKESVRVQIHSLREEFRSIAMELHKIRDAYDGSTAEGSESTSTPLKKTYGIQWKH